MTVSHGPWAAVGWAVDSLVGEPPIAVHPVARFGSFATFLEQRIYEPTRVRGVAFTMICTGGAAAIGMLVNRLIGRRAATSVATAVCVAGKMLFTEARSVAELLNDGDLEQARVRTQGLVGRRTGDLDETEISRAVIESVAENTVDAVVSSLFWASVGGAPLVLVHRASNTLDAMVGHRNARYRQFGWASARFDDVLNYLPARLGALGIVFLRPRRARAVLTAAFRDGRRHPSPNGGVIEGAIAGAIGVRLGGVNEYDSGTENRGFLGNGPTPSHRDIESAVSLLIRLTALSAAISGSISPIVAGLRRLSKP